MVSKAREDLPEPLRPVMTVNALRGISTLMFLRLCCRAPRTVILSMANGLWFPISRRRPHRNFQRGRAARIQPYLNGQQPERSIRATFSGRFAGVGCFAGVGRALREPYSLCLITFGHGLEIYDLKTAGKLHLANGNSRGCIGVVGPNRNRHDLGTYGTHNNLSLPGTRNLSRAGERERTLDADALPAG